MKEESRFMVIIGNITLWRTLKAVAIITLVSVMFSVVVEAYTSSQAFVWTESRVVTLTWNPPPGEYHHYRVEISKTDLLEEPVTTYLSYAYVKESHFQIEAQDDHSYMFRIQSVTRHGALSDFSDPSCLFICKEGDVMFRVSSTDVSPVEFSLSQNYPNPFNSRTSIEYQVSDSGIGQDGTTVHLAIHNVLGQRVKVLVDEVQAPGEYLVNWDGRNDAGQEVASGRYFYRLNAGEFSASKKMILVK